MANLGKKPTTSETSEGDPDRTLNDSAESQTIFDTLATFFMAQRGDNLPVNRFDPAAKGSNFRIWLSQYDAAATAYGLVDQQKALSVNRYVAPGVARWIHTLPVETARDWKALKESLTDNFGLSTYEEKQEAKRALKSCRQGREEPIRAFTVRFRYLLAEVPGGLSNEEEVDIFLCALHPSLRNSLLALTFGDLHAAIEAAATLERRRNRDQEASDRTRDPSRIVPSQKGKPASPNQTTKGSLPHRCRGLHL
jgi:Retrotransposon gag protein